MLRRLHNLLLAGMVLGGTLGTAFSEEVAQRFAKEVRPVMAKLCFDCHGPEKQKGDIRFDDLKLDLASDAQTSLWEDALDQVSFGEMPPHKAPQPSAEQHTLLVDWMNAALEEAAAQKRFADGRVVTRRLTRYEYENTMTDLLGVSLDYARELPPEPPSAEGFQNNGATLEMSPTLVEMYLRSARRGLAEAIVTGTAPEVFQMAQEKTEVGRIPARKIMGARLVNPEFLMDVDPFPRKGEFELRIQAEAAIPEGQALPRMHIAMGHFPGLVHAPRLDVGKVDVPEEPTTFTFRGRMEDFPQPGDIPFGNVPFKGMVVLVDYENAKGKELRYEDTQYVLPLPQPKAKKGEAPPPPPKPAPPFGSRLDIRILHAEFRAPVYASWPPPSHEQLMASPQDWVDESHRAEALLAKFMKRAFRRPVQDAEITQMRGLFLQIRPQMESFEAAMREVYAAVLVSPHFLYRVETRQGDGPEALSDYELASRLSYFLWSSMPDAELMELADAGTLGQSKVLGAQIGRMLEDPRSKEFLERFVDQWLDLDALHRVAVNPEVFPDFDESLKDDMRAETLATFEAILRSDTSALQLLDADWVLVNRNLAEHYGLEGPRSSALERVTLPKANSRGGLLGQGSYLLANSNGEDSHPIKRAVWILDRLLDAPPASPPPDVPDLDADSPDLAGLSLKEQLAVHREKESCANCHQGIDPWGIPLERFDAVGGQRMGKVDAASLLPDGTSLNGVQPLKRYLVEQRAEWFARSLVKRLLGYSLGRSLDVGDRQTVEALTQQFVENDYRLKGLILDLVKCESFQTK